MTQFGESGRFLQAPLYGTRSPTFSDHGYVAIVPSVNIQRGLAITWFARASEGCS